MQLMAEKFMNQQEGLFGSALLKKEATLMGGTHKTA